MGSGDLTNIKDVSQHVSMKHYTFWQGHCIDHRTCVKIKIAMQACRKLPLEVQTKDCQHVKNCCKNWCKNIQEEQWQ